MPVSCVRNLNSTSVRIVINGKNDQLSIILTLTRFTGKEHWYKYTTLLTMRTNHKHLWPWYKSRSLLASSSLLRRHRVILSRMYEHHKSIARINRWLSERDPWQQGLPLWWSTVDDKTPRSICCYIRSCANGVQNTVNQFVWKSYFGDEKQ